MPDDPVTFEHFEIARRPDGGLFELGRGAMGVTYKAYDTRLEGYVALKVINSSYLHDDVGRERFLREARAAAHLDHPNIAAIFHRGQEGGTYFYAMQFIEGETVDSFVRRRGPLPVGLALRLILQTAQGLAAANARGLIHRDIKPANLMLVHLDDAGMATTAGGGNDEDLLLKVIDFGLAKVVRNEDAENATLSLTGGGPIGTPYYMSPEQIDSSVGDVDARTDIYSLGVTLWYLLTGQPPFVGSQFQVFQQHINARPPLEQLPVAVPDGVRALLARMLGKTPADRPANMRELIGALRELLRGSLPPGSAGDSTGGFSSTAPTVVPGAITLDQSAEGQTMVDTQPPPSVSASAPTVAPPPGPADSQRPPTVTPPPLAPVQADVHRPPTVPPPVVAPVSQPGAFVDFHPTPNASSPAPADPHQSSVSASAPTVAPPPVVPPSPPPVGPVFPPLTPPGPSHRREWKVFGAIALAVLLLGGIGVLLFLHPWNKGGNNPPASPSPVPSPSVTPVASPSVPPSVSPSVPPSPGPSVTPKSSVTPKPSIRPPGPTPSPSVAPRGARTLTVPGDYATIGAAIEAAKSGDTVKVAAGTYHEKVTFKDGIHLIGAGSDATTVACAGTSECFEAHACHSGTISGFTFRHTSPNKAGGAYVVVVWLNASAVQFTECHVLDSGSIGIECDEGDQSTVADCEIGTAHTIGIRVRDSGTKPTLHGNEVHESGDTGIVFSNGAEGLAENNTCENNEAFGLLITGHGTAPTLSGNTARRNKLTGIAYQEGAGGTATDNDARENIQAGFRLSESGTAPILKNNTAADNSLSGIIYTAGAGGTATENTCINNKEAGLVVTGQGTAPTLRENHATRNKLSGMEFSGGSVGTAEANVIADNAQSGIYVYGTGTAPTLRKNEIHGNKFNGIYFTELGGGIADGNICENNLLNGILVSGKGTSPTLRANKCANNGKESVHIENGATPKTAAPSSDFFN